MPKTDVSGLSQPGAEAAQPATPGDALLEKVPAGHSGGPRR